MYANDVVIIYRNVECLIRDLSQNNKNKPHFLNYYYFIYSSYLFSMQQV